MSEGPAMEQNEVDTNPSALGTSSFRWVLVGLMSIMLLSALDHTIVVIALPVIVEDLGSAESLTAVVTGYMLASSLSALWFGQIADLWGRRPTLLVCVLGFVVASAACGLAQTLPQLIGLRVAQGIAAGGLLTLSQTIIADLVPPRERGRYQGYVLSVFGAASVAGPFVGGALTDHLSWRAIFLVNVPVGGLALLILVRSLHGSFGVLGRRTSLLSSVALGASAVLVLVAVSLVGERSSPMLIGLMAGVGSAIFAGFLLIERRARNPLFASRSLRSRLYVLSNVSGFAVHAAMMGAVILMPLYLQGVLDMTAAETGLAMLPQVMAWLLATLVCGVLISRTGRLKVFAGVGAGLNAVGLLLLAQLGASSSLWVIGASLAVFGLGQGLALQSLTVASQAQIPSEEMGQATGLSSFARSVGAVLGVALSGAMVGLLIASHHTLENALQLTLGAAVPVATVGLVFAVLMPEVKFSGRMGSAPSLH